MFKEIIQRFKKNKPENNRLYSRCSETPLDVFIDCVVNKNYSRLIREGKPLQKEIDAAWQKLWFEYCDLSGSAEYRQLFQLIKEAGYLEGKILSIRLAIQCISASNSTDCINILHNYGYRYAFDRANPDEFAKDIERVVTKSKSIELLLQSTKSQIDKINARQSGEKATETYFDDYLTVLSRHMGFRINRKVISVTEFLRMKKMYELETERINEKIEQTKR